jgi:4-hydroxy-3-polyprenylbenzoate decarboxylase
MESIVIGISGASGVILGFKTVEACCKAGLFVDLIMTDAARRTTQEELSLSLESDSAILQRFPDEIRQQIRCLSIENIGATAASGTYRTCGMMVVPCSMATLAAISLGLADNLLRRAADVTIKEGRPLLLAPRETPLSPIHLEHMLKLSRLGVVIMPPEPAWYQKPKSIDEIEDSIVARMLDRFGLPSDLRRWKG